MNSSYQRDIRKFSEDFDLHFDLSEVMVDLEANSPQDEVHTDETDVYLLNNIEYSLRKMLTRDFRRSNLYSPNYKPKFRKF